MNFEIAPKSTEIKAIWSDARLYCFSLGEGWRLPSKAELNRIYESENDFENGWYWSSVERSDNRAWNQYFNRGGRGGGGGGGDKNSAIYVRAVRDLKDNNPT